MKSQAPALSVGRGLAYRAATLDIDCARLSLLGKSTEGVKVFPFLIVWVDLLWTAGLCLSVEGFFHGLGAHEVIYGQSWIRSVVTVSFLVERF